jgi:hypothetical protein
LGKYLYGHSGGLILSDLSALLPEKKVNKPFARLFTMSQEIEIQEK